ncbi:hypothetical protein CH333_00710 [candidate division WOR-3 bacterium JGI_Cruoil_03_44_89]|mgnify:CR=1 FL=1|uniref:Uncharacterized protein n=1 Tax=candidate division WOR-3 bacterium JGI_Cruoil_03_44_89 TaxID=1973748 RepID=A0A235BZ15_UNCW3|nr:MAG: hypothetical protein CH333_00710 [candidate division WOR-3 bacterium JGI_Cruoil_03_44_89]
MVRKILFIVCALFILFVGCKREHGAVEPNLPPWIEIKQPPANDSIVSDTTIGPYFALQTITWNAGDDDGYPVLYKYRYITHHLYRGDSLIQDWIETEECEALVAFESSDTLNLQKFEVMAKDNRGDWSTSAVRFYYTKKVERPETEIISPNEGDTLLFLSYTTERYHGVRLTFTGNDTLNEEGEIVGFSYRVDEGEWSSFRVDTSTYVRPTLFEPPFERIHTIEVKSKNNANVEDDTPAQVHVSLIVPSFGSSILLVDETKDGTGGPERPTDEDVDAFYRNILLGHTFDEWDYKTQGFPGRTRIGDYRLIIWHSDDTGYEFNNHAGIIGDYLMVGGNLWLSGWGILSTFSPDVNVEYSVGDFVYDYLQIKSSVLNTSNDFKGGIWGEGDSVLTDTTKLYRFHYMGLPSIRVIKGRTGWTKPLVSFISSSSDTAYQGKPCGVIYKGTTYSTVLLDFPLYYMKEDGAGRVCGQILEYFGE